MSKDTDMLGRIVGKLVGLPVGILGVIYDLLERLCGESRDQWRMELKEFLRRKSQWKIVMDCLILLDEIRCDPCTSERNRRLKPGNVIGFHAAGQYLTLSAKNDASSCMRWACGDERLTTHPVKDEDDFSQLVGVIARVHGLSVGHPIKTPIYILYVFGESNHPAHNLLG